MRKSEQWKLCIETEHFSTKNNVMFSRESSKSNGVHQNSLLRKNKNGGVYFVRSGDSNSDFLGGPFQPLNLSRNAGFLVSLIAASKGLLRVLWGAL